MRIPGKDEEDEEGEEDEEDEEEEEDEEDEEDEEESCWVSTLLMISSFPGLPT